MALIACPECGGKISDQAKICVHCGYPLKRAISTFKITLLEIPELSRWNEQRVKIITEKIDNVLRKVTKLEHSQIDSLINNRPSVLLDGLSEKNADILVREFTEAGATVEKQESDSLLDGRLNVVIDAYVRGGVICPKCGSTQIAFIPMKLSPSADYYNFCQKCGHKWVV